MKYCDFFYNKLLVNGCSLITMISFNNDLIVDGCMIIAVILFYSKLLVNGCYLNSVISVLQKETSCCDTFTVSYLSMVVI